MDREWLLQWYHRYALLLGVTSHYVVKGRVRQNLLTKGYALIVNVNQLVTLPGLFWLSIDYIKRTNWFPNLVPYTSFILYAASYFAIAYTILSRGCRDGVLLELEHVVIKIRRRLTQCEGRLLAFVFYFKFCTMFLMVMCSVLMCFMMPNEGRWNIILVAFLFQSAMIIPNIAAYRYFLALWYIACSYKTINMHLEKLTKNGKAKFPKTEQIQELSRLWYLHAVLGRCTVRLNKVFGFLTLAARFDYVIFSCVNGYWGLLFMFAVPTPAYVLVFGMGNYWLRLIDFYLLDYICDLTARYHDSPLHIASEGLWYKELNAYLIYTSSSKLSIWVCGLYKANAERWFRMIVSISQFSILLLQFHLLIRNKFSL